MRAIACVRDILVQAIEKLLVKSVVNIGKSSTMDDVSLHAHGTECLNDVPGFKKHQKLRHMTSTLQLQFTSDDGGKHAIKFRYLGAGESRVVYSSCDDQHPYVLKISHLSYKKDDNKLEYDVSKDMPAWLVPRVFHYGTQALCHQKISLLVVERFELTMSEIIDMVQTLPFEFETFKWYIKAIGAVLLLIWRVATETSLTVSDWHIQNLAISEWPQGEMRLIDWADTTSNAGVAAYTRIKQARVSFLQYMPGLAKPTQTAKSVKDWLEIQEKVSIYIGKKWWPKGLFAGSAMHGVPEEADIVELQRTLLTKFGGSFPKNTFEGPSSLFLTRSEQYS